MAEDASPNQTPATEPIRLTVDGRERVFDIEDPVLPGWVEEAALTSGGFPYDHKMKKDEYEDELGRLQLELVRMQAWLARTDGRVLILFEGRDAAGKGGTISVLHEYLNPRRARNVALMKPTEVERGQWYYQRYIEWFPTAGELVSFDRSWYNRAGVEPVMGFCTPEQHRRFLDETPRFERLIVEDGIHFFKIWLNIGREMQLKRFHDRRHNPLKDWKFTPIDVGGMTKWDEYTARRDEMLRATDSKQAPWTVVESNDKRRARLAVIRRLLLSIPYEGRDLDAIGKEDDRIVRGAAKFLKRASRLGG